MKVREVFITLCSTMMTMSQSPSTDVVRALTAGAFNSDARLDDVGAEMPRSAPPIFTYLYAFAGHWD